MQILAISGSLRQGSHNSALLRAAATLPPPGAEMVFFDQLESIPAFNEDRLEPRPPQEQILRDAVAEADGVLDRHPRVQQLDPGCARKCARLAVATQIRRARSAANPCWSSEPR